MSCLIVPGLQSSGPGHWQSRWEDARDDCRRVELGNWDDPTRFGWIAGLARAIDDEPGFPILIAHSLGCLAVAWWAAIAGRASAKVTGALLVAPPDPERTDVDPRIARFAPPPRQPLPFPSIVVASRDDPYAGFDWSRDIAKFWSARFYDAGEAGHINADSKLGCWDAGQALVAELCQAASSTWSRPRRFGTRA